MEDKILEIIKEESENANVRKYTCINGFGYSQFERNIAERVVKLFCQPVDISRLKFKLEVNAGRLAEPLLKAGKQPKDDENCHKAFLMLAHLKAIEDYINDIFYEIKENSEDIDDDIVDMVNDNFWDLI